MTPSREQCRADYSPGRNVRQAYVPRMYKKFSQNQKMRAASFDHLVGEGQHGRGNLQSERLGGLDVDGELEGRGSLGRQLAGLGAFENSIGKSRQLPEDVRNARAIRN